jgi:chromosome segregation ATPase
MRSGRGGGNSTPISTRECEMVNEELQNAVTELANLNVEKDELEGNLQTTETELAELQEGLNTCETEFAEVQAANDGLMGANIAFVDQVSNLVAQISDLTLSQTVLEAELWTEVATLKLLNNHRTTFAILPNPCDNLIKN